MKPNILYKISLIIFGVSFLALVAAMIFHAVQGDGSDSAVIIAIVSAATAFVGIVLACLSSKIRNEKNETD